MAAEFMEAISLQDKAKAIKFHDVLFEHQTEFHDQGEAYLKKLTKEVGADVAKVEKDRKGDLIKKRIDADMAEAKTFDFNNTPGFVINGGTIPGAYPYEFFKRVVDSLLADKKG
jgi:protein-disulfide isomerase